MLKHRRPDWLLLAVVLLSVGVRAVFATLPRMARWDEASYLLIARNLLAGQGYRELVGGFDMHQPPLITLLAAAGMMLHLPLKWAAALPAHVLLGGLSVLPLYALGRVVYGRSAGLLAALLGALYPALAVGPLYSGSLTESPALLLILSGVYATYRTGEAIARNNRAAGWAALAGACFGLGYLARPESLMFALVMLLYLGMMALLRRQRTLGRTLQASVLMGVTLALVMSPYVIYLHRITGYWTLSGKAGTGMEIAWALVNHDQTLHDLAAASLDSSGEKIIWLSSEGLAVGMGDWIAANPQRFQTLVKYNMRSTVEVLFSAPMVGLPVAALAVVGLFSRRWDRRRWQTHFLLLLTFVPLAGLWVAFIDKRLLLVSLAVVLLPAGAGLAHIMRWAAQWPGAQRATRLSRVVAGLPVALLVAWLMWSGVQTARASSSTLPFYRLETARWLAENTPSDTRIMTRNAETVLYADRAMVAFPNAAWELVIRYAQSHGASYLVVDEWEINTVRPFLQPLLTPTTPSPLPHIELVQVLPHAGRDTYIYRFVDMQSAP